MTPGHQTIHHNLSVSLSSQLDITKTTQPVINMTGYDVLVYVKVS